ncbi:MAG: sensor histidine kinase [Sulfitobacter sp.]
MLDAFAVFLRAASHLINAKAGFNGVSILDEYSIHIRVLKFLKNAGASASGQNGNAGIRGPAAAFKHYLNPVCARHCKVQYGAIRLQSPDHSNRFDSIRRGANNSTKPITFQSRNHPRRCKGMVVRNENCLLQWVFVRSICLALLTWGLLCSQVNAQSHTLALSGPTSAAEITGHIDHYVDSDWTLTPGVANGSDSPEFLSIGRENPDFGYTKSRIWLRVKVTNTTPDVREWIIYFPENFKQYFRVYTARENGQIETALQLDEDSNFDVRPIHYPELAAPLTLAPGETATIYISLWSEGSSYISFSFETVDSFTTLSSGQTAKNFVFYGMMILLIVAALVSLLMLRNWIFLAYSAYAASALLYIMHVDGVAFQYLWPNFPGLNSKASIFAGSGIIVFGAIYSRMYLKTARLHHIMDKVLLGVIAITVSLDVTLFFTNPQLLKKILIFMSLLAITCFAFAGCVAALKRYREVRFYLFAWIGAMISAVLLNLNHLFGVGLDQTFIYDSLRTVMVFDAAMMGLAIVDRYNQLRGSQAVALERSLGEAKRNLELSERLTALTGNYDNMVNDARTRDERIQNTVHDLRQPLHSLRMKVGDMIRNANNEPDDVNNINATFSYLETLIAEYQIQSGDQQHAAPTMASGTLNLEQILSSLTEMFAQDAAEKGVLLKLDYQPAQTSTDPLTIMRILSNLVSNAVKYTHHGSVTIDVVTTNQTTQIVITDTGPGLSENEFGLALGRDIRLLEKSGIVEGTGLGLSIANDLARKNGIKLELVPTSGHGTKIVVTFPKD